MPPSPERQWPHVVAGYAVFVTLVGAGSAPVYFILEPAHRPLVIRLVAALILGVVVIHSVKTVRARLEAQPPSSEASPRCSTR